MAIATSTILAGAALATTATTTVDGIVKSNKANKALDNLQVPEYENPNRNISISTLGSDLIKEEGQRTTANILDTLQGGSARNIFSALPGLVATNNQINQQAGLDIDKQMLDREYAIAGYEERLNGVEENRYQRELSGIGAMYDAGQNQVWNGVNGMISSAGALGRSLDGDKKTDPNNSILNA